MNKPKLPVKIHMEKGALPGYTLKDKQNVRRKTLDGIVKHLG